MLSILGNIFGTGEVVKKGLELIRILLKYPKLTIFMVIGLYVMTFDSVRKTIFGG